MRRRGWTAENRDKSSEGWPCLPCSSAGAICNEPVARLPLPLHALPGRRLGDDSDNVRYDPTARRLFVGYGGGALAAISPNSSFSFKVLTVNIHKGFTFFNRKFMLPELREARIIEHLVGLRPGRPTVRLEAEPQPNGKVVIHNYGHGGAGVTLSWGCAEEVTSLVHEAE